MWLKNALRFKLNSLSSSTHEFLKCLRSLAFNCRDGPWKHTYIRFGYDPRQHRDSLVYQVVSLNVNDLVSEQAHPYDPTMREKAHLIRACYQLCDIHDQKVKNEVWAERSRDDPACDKRYGFIKKRVFRKIVKWLKNK